MTGYRRQKTQVSAASIRKPVLIRLSDHQQTRVAISAEQGIKEEEIE